MTFKDLGIMPSILKALEESQYTIPTSIQEQAIPPILAGRDLLGCAQTGTGKTAAFAVPTLQRLSGFDSNTGRINSVDKGDFGGYTGKDNSADKNNSEGYENKDFDDVNYNSNSYTRNLNSRTNSLNNSKPQNPKRVIRALVLTPTRELAMQIYESFRTYGRHVGLRSCVIFGGVSQKPQEDTLSKGVDILVATPGRLCDLMSQRLIDLRHIEIMILDEADRMLDMGFSHDVKKIISKTPEERQTLFFSATMPLEIVKMSSSMLVNPVKLEITPESPTVEAISQSVYFVDKLNKRLLLLHLLKNPDIESALIFTRTKHGADRVVKDLLNGQIPAQAIHGNKSQNARQHALDSFKKKATRILVATDIAARGIDIDCLSHVFNFDLPEIPESYVHRIGRTGRAGQNGVAISFCDFEEKKLLVAIEKWCAKPIPVIDNHPYPLLITTILPKPEVHRRGERGLPGTDNGRHSENRRGDRNQPGTANGIHGDRKSQNRSAGQSKQNNPHDTLKNKSENRPQDSSQGRSQNRTQDNSLLDNSQDRTQRRPQNQPHSKPQSKSQYKPQESRGNRILHKVEF